MDKDPIESPHNQDQINDSADEINESQFQSGSASNQQRGTKSMRRPGRPSFRAKVKSQHQQKNIEFYNENDEDFDTEKPKLKEKNHSQKEERENSIDGFVKIIDYLKKIQCDEASLHNKMNPFNLLTPTCFWYMISAEYFSFDFFNNRNVHELALELLKKAQKTQILLPLRMLKIQKNPEELDFETPQLREFSIPITEKLVSLIPLPSHSPPETVQRSTFVTSVSEDNQFRSSVRSISFNWIKKKISASEKWGLTIKPKLECASKLPTKDFTSKVLQCKEEMKHEQLDVAPQIYYRQRKIQKSSSEIKNVSKPTPAPKKAAAKVKKSTKKVDDDQIYDESESEEVIKNEQMIDENKDEKKDENVESANKMEEENIEMKIEDQIKQDNQNMEPIGDNNIIKTSIQEFGSQNINSDDQQNNAKLQQIIISKKYTEDDLLLDSILHLPIDTVISILKSSIEPVRLPELVRPYLPIPKSDPLQLVYQTHPEQDVFLDYMRDRQQKHFVEKTVHSQSLIQQREREGQAEDAKCQVCTDGDYTDDNLIVFCSMCNISLHQRCVGLAKVPADNWICQVCASFGPAGINVPCPICHVRGGALKRTSIHINTPIFKDTNPQYHEFAKKCPNYKHKEEYPRPSLEDEPYYDYFSKASYPDAQPVCHFVWVHYVCAIWVPECYFQEKNGLINVKGIENIDKKRFKERCLVCNLSKAGACVKCQNQNCTKYYHPQCARKRKIYMEQLNLDRLKYLIFCEAHEPLKVKRKIEVKKKKQRDEIVKFCRGIEKYVETYKIAYLPFKLLKLGVNSSNEVSKVDKNRVAQGELKVSVKIDKNTDEDFIRSVIDGLIKQNQIVVILSVLGSKKFKVDEVVKPSKRDMRKSLTRQDEFWKNYKNTETPETNLKRFNQIMRQNNFLREMLDNFINYGVNPDDKEGNDDRKGRGNVRRRREKIETVIEQQGAIFCVCRKPYEGENDMFECQVCNEWYHHECIGFVGSEQDAQTLDFHCMKCLKYEPIQNKKALLDKCSKFFSEDSLFLNYRPPTPSLQSEDQDEGKQIKSPHRNRDENQPKQLPVPIQKSENKNPKKAPIHGDQNKLLDIPYERINLQKPFIVFDPKNSNIEIENGVQIKGPNWVNRLEKMKDKEQKLQEQRVITNNEIMDGQQIKVPQGQLHNQPIQNQIQKQNYNMQNLNENQNQSPNPPTLKQNDHMDIEQPQQLKDEANSLHFNRAEVQEYKKSLEGQQEQKPNEKLDKSQGE